MGEVGEGCLVAQKDSKPDSPFLWKGRLYRLRARTKSVDCFELMARVWRQCSGSCRIVQFFQVMQ